MVAHRSFRLTRMGNDEIAEHRSVGEELFRAVLSALIQQTATLSVAALILDGGFLFRCCVLASLASWICASVIVVRRPKQPTAFDLAVVKFGFWFLLTIVIQTAFVRGAVLP